MISDVWGSCFGTGKKVCYTWCQVPDFFCNYWKQLPISPASQKDISETGWMEIKQIWKKHIWISCKKCTVFSPLTPTIVLCPGVGSMKKKRGLIRGHCRLCGDASGFFLSHLATLTARHDWTFWIRGGCKLSIWGDIYIYDIYISYKISIFGGIFFWGENMQYIRFFEGGD